MEIRRGGKIVVRVDGRDVLARSSREPYGRTVLSCHTRTNTMFNVYIFYNRVFFFFFYFSLHDDDANDASFGGISLEEYVLRIVRKSVEQTYVLANYS